MIRENKWNILGLTLSFIIIALFVYIARYALPSTDDFSYVAECNMAIANANGNVLQGIWDEFVAVYYDHQGSYFALISSFIFFSLFMLRPLVFRLVIGAIICVFFYGLIRLMRSICLQTDARMIWGMVAFLALWIGVDMSSPAEAMYYMCGACTYALPLGVSFLAIANFLDAIHTNRMRHTIAATFLGFLGAGGVLICGGFLNMIMLSILVLYSAYHHRFRLKYFIPWFVTLAGSLLNALAPGHMNRHYAYEASGSLNIGDTLINTFLIMMKRIGLMFSQNYMLVGMLILTVLVLFVLPRPAKEKLYIHPIWMFIIALLTIYTSLFPVVLGYSSKFDDKMELRIQFAISVIISISLFAALLYTLCYIRAYHDWYWLYNHKLFVISALLSIGLTIGSFFLMNVTRTEYQPTITTMVTELSNHNLEKSYLSIYKVYLQAEKTCYDGVCIAKNEVTLSPILPNPNLSSDPTFWVDYAICRYYGLHHFSYSPSEDRSLEELREVVAYLKTLQKGEYYE